MYRIGWKIVCSNKKRYFTVILLFSAILALFLTQFGVLFQRMHQSSSVIGKMRNIAIWVMHPHAQIIDDYFPISMDTQNSLQNLEGVDAACPLIVGNVVASLAKGKNQRCHLIGGVPQNLGGLRNVIEGNLHSLEHARTVFVDKQSLFPFYPKRFARKTKGILGTHLKINDRVLRTVGVFDRESQFTTQPLLYTNLAQARELLNIPSDCALYYGIKVSKDADIKRLCQQITRQTGLKAIKHTEFIANSITHYLHQEHTIRYYWALVSSGVILIFVLFFVMLRYFAFLLSEHLLPFRAMGASAWNLLQVTGVQSLLITGGSWLLGMSWYLAFVLLVGITPAFSLIANEVYLGALGLIGLITVLAASIAIKIFLSHEEDLIYRL